MLKLYGAQPTRVMRVLWAINELGLDCEVVPVNPGKGDTRTPEFLQLNPAAKVPVLVDGDLVLNESAAIVLYLAEKHRDKGLLPADLKQRADAYRWTLFAMTELEQPVWRITKHTFVYPEDKRLAGDIALAREDFRAMAAVLEQHMQNREFIVGNAISVADCVTAYTLDWADVMGLLAGFPQLSAYLTRMYARPTAPLRIATVMAKNQAQ